MCPFPCFFMMGVISRQPLITEMRLISSTVCISSSFMFSTSAILTPAPWLLTRTSIRPNLSSVFAISVFQSAVWKLHIVRHQASTLLRIIFCHFTSMNDTMSRKLYKILICRYESLPAEKSQSKSFNARYTEITKTRQAVNLIFIYLI